MDLVQLDQDRDASAEHLICPCSPDIYDIFGDPQVLPRVGDEYQVEIPPLVTESDCLPPVKETIHTEVMADAAKSFIMELPIPIMWVNNEVRNVKMEPMEFFGNPDNAVNMNRSVELKKCVESPTNINDKDSGLKVEALNVLLDDGKGIGRSASLETTIDSKIDMAMALPQEKKTNLDQNYRGRDYHLVPGSVGDSWSDTEQDSFLLGLYIFGKNLLQVKKFIESKDMGNILSFYYGKFYRSDRHRKWSECRKIRRKRSIHGQRIFTGWRQQELLSRLLPYVSDKYHNTLLEVSRTFGEGKLSLEEYVSTLKASVGMNVLIEAVGIGKGKQDLTGIFMEQIKTNPVVSLRPEIPIGKACSSLTSGDIIKFLTGDFRLSKARSNDLFWEAVWPRLLARGWHSEQPKNHSYACSKQSLVFLMPGIKKFSRRRLVKGNHYFDSVTDVLNKVASDPGLLELEVEAAKGNESKKDYVLDTEKKLKQDGMSDHQRHSYLRPRISNCNLDLRKFTIVDTSLVHEGPSKVRELRSLPTGMTNTSTHTSPSSETDEDTSDESLDEPRSAEILSLNQWQTNYNPANGISEGGVHPGFLDCLINVSNQGVPINGLGPTNEKEENHKDHDTNSSDERPNKNIKCQFSRRTKAGPSNYLAPVSKQRKLMACSSAETSHNMDNFSVGSELQQKEVLFQSGSPEPSKNMVSQLEPPQGQISSTSPLVKGHQGDTSEGILSGTCFDRNCHEKPQFRTLIDLNLPHVPPDFGTGEPYPMEVEESKENSSTKGPSLPSETSEQSEDPGASRNSDVLPYSEQQSTENARRQSTRNRPLTTKALEALACGFLNTKKRRRGTETLSRGTSTPRSSRRPRRRVEGTANFSNVGTNVNSKVEKGSDDVFSGDINMVSKSQDQSERKGAHELVGIHKGAYNHEVLVYRDELSG